MMPDPIFQTLTCALTPFAEECLSLATTVSVATPPVVPVPAGTLDMSRFKILTERENQLAVPGIESQITRAESSLAGLTALNEKTLPLVERYSSLQKAEVSLKELQQIRSAIRRPTVVRLCEVTEENIVKALSVGNSEAAAQAMESIPVLRKFAEVEIASLAIMERVGKMYPEGTRLAYQLDFSRANPEVARFLPEEEGGIAKYRLDRDEPSLTTLKDLPLIKSYETLKISNPSWTSAADKAFSKFRFEQEALYSDRLAGNVKFFGRISTTLEEVRRSTEDMEKTYLSSDFHGFLHYVKLTEAEESGKNDAFKVRQELATSVATMETLAKLEAAFNRPIGEIKDGVTPSMLIDVRFWFFNRAQSYKYFLEEEETRGGPNAQTIHSRLGEVQKDIDALVALDCDRTEEAFSGLRDFCGRLSMDYEDRHAQGLLGRLLSDAEKIPSSRERDYLERVKDRLGQLDGISETKDRAQFYREIDSGLIAGTVSRVIDARRKQYEAYFDEERQAAVTTQMTSDPLGWLENKVPDFSRSSNLEIIGKYDILQSKIHSENPGTRWEGLREYQALEGSAFREELERGHESDSNFNTFTKGVAIMLTAGFCAEVAVELAAPYVEGMIGEGLILNAIAGGTFTVSHHLIGAAVRGTGVVEEAEKMAEDPFGLATEMALNTGMFAFMGKAMRLSSKYFEKGLETVARRMVTKSGKFLSEMGEEAFSRAVQAEVKVLRGNLAVGMAETIGVYGSEISGLQAWQFLVDAGRLTANGDPEALKKAKDNALSSERWVHTGAFILSARVMSVLAKPILHPVLEPVRDFAMGKRLDRALRRLDGQLSLDEIEKKRDAFFVEGKGGLEEVMGDWMLALAQKRQTLEEIPESLRDRKSYQDAVRQTDSAIAEVNGLLTFCLNYPKIFNEGNSFGVKASRFSDQPVFTYRPGAGSRLVGQLKNLGNTEVKTLGEVVVAETALPGGHRLTRIFAPEGRSQQPPLLAGKIQ